mmetsp:Transcript_93327/g.216990  ORF Transcript_93327/g.216990 Transcript_93327/m.216990 type:complete len:284 (-) Transcript_93327:193-1044(-)
MLHEAAPLLVRCSLCVGSGLPVLAKTVVLLLVTPAEDVSVDKTAARLQPLVCACEEDLPAGLFQVMERDRRHDVVERRRTKIQVHEILLVVSNLLLVEAVPVPAQAQGLFGVVHHVEGDTREGCENCRRKVTGATPKLQYHRRGRFGGQRAHGHCKHLIVPRHPHVDQLVVFHGELIKLLLHPETPHQEHQLHLGPKALGLSKLLEVYHAVRIVICELHGLIDLLRQGANVQIAEQALQLHGADLAVAVCINHLEHIVIGLLSRALGDPVDELGQVVGVPLKE